eukprot:TRINITY_DN34150_c0_g1_i1.p1 TRINITY_DN34150_c0_g1~~TRINITY_DN34150_c0_g1_i1.p1  ORF type:complete len:392 (-),score=89.16 TRINITY_DN34150_c0_g1_i1:309-1484(-)
MAMVSRCSLGRLRGCRLLNPQRVVGTLAGDARAGSSLCSADTWEMESMAGAVPSAPSRPGRARVQPDTTDEASQGRATLRSLRRRSSLRSSTRQHAADADAKKRRLQLADPWAPLADVLKMHSLSGSRADEQPSARACEEVLFFWSDLRPKEPTEIEAATFFRALAEMPPVERHALELCRQHGGKVMDIGAGAGSHALALQELGLESVEAIDIDTTAVEVMRQRGVAAARACCMWDVKDLSHLTSAVMLMNSIGCVGNMRRLYEFLTLLHSRMRTGAHLVLDVSPPSWDDIQTAASRRVQPLREGSFRLGEWAVLQCWLSSSSGLSGKMFPYLFLEPQALAVAASETGWSAKVVFQDAATRHALMDLERLEPEPKEADSRPTPEAARADLR